MKRALAGVVLCLGASLLWTNGTYAQEAAAQSTPPTRERLREQYTPADHERFLEKERQGLIPSQAGPVGPAKLEGKDQRILSPGEITSPGETLDGRANNNGGATGTSGFTQSETTIVAFGSTVVLGFNDSGSNAGGANKFTGWAWSTDGGLTFTDGGTLPTNTIGDAGDPVLARNETTGRIYFSTLGFSGAGTIQMFRSDDGGVTWQAPVNATPGGSSEDKQWHTVDNFAGAGQGNVYLLSRRFGAGPGIYFFRSTDDGNTFGPSGGTLIVSGSQGAFVTVGPDHAVYAFWFAGATLQMRKSTDQGLTFGPPVTVASGLAGGTNGDLALTGIRQGTATEAGFRSNSFPHVAVNPVSGDLYVTFNDNPAGTDKADVFMVMSTDGGATWSARVRVNDDATTTDQWQPTIAVTPDGASLGIFYYSRQEDPANNLFRYYGRTGIISGSTVTFTPSFAISDVASLPEFGRDSVINSTYMGDYDFAVATPGYFHVVWADNRDDLPGGAGRKDPNIYYDKVVAGTLPGPNISVSPTAVDFGTVAVTQTATRQITIVNIGDSPLTVSAITSPTPDFSVSSPALPAVIPSLGSIVVTASFAPATLGAQASSFTITSDAANTPDVTVDLSGTGGTNISVSPLSIDFGTVPVGQSAGPVPVTIRNTGTVDLTITAISPPGGDFAVTHPALPLVLPAGGTATVNAFFSPWSPGLQTSSFDILSDAFDSPGVTVALQGFGIVPPPNDLCTNAFPLTCGQSITGTTQLATFDNVGTCTTSNTAPGVWYTVTGTGAPTTVSTCAGATYDTKISVFSGSCGALTCVGGNDDATGCGLRSSVTFNSVVGETYYVLVHGFQNQTGDFTLSASQCPAQISVTPTDLSFDLPPNGNASSQLSLANTADLGALDLTWAAYSRDGVPMSVAGAQPTVDTSPVAVFQVTDATLTALQSGGAPPVIRNSLRNLVMGEPPVVKDEFMHLLVGALGAVNAEAFAQLIMENAVTFQDGLKDQPDAEPAAAGGPDGFGYEFKDSDEPDGPAFNWVDITGTGTPVVLGDDAAVLVPLPFAFPFYGVGKTQVRISSNGYLTFGTSGTTFTNAGIPNTAVPNDLIAPFWDDLNPALGGTIHYLSGPTQFIVQYTNIRRFGTTTPTTFQVILNADGSILFQYLDMQQALLTSATVGVENATGTIGLQVVFNAAYLKNSLAVRIALPPPCSWISSLVPSSGTVPAGSAQPSSVNVAATGLSVGVYECHVKVLSNAANTPRVNVPVTLRVKNPTTLAVSPASGTYYGTTTLSATLTSSGSPLAGRSIDFTLNGTSVGSALTDASGVATLPGASLAGIDAGGYPAGVGASFAGEDEYLAASGSASLTVTRAPTTTTVTCPVSVIYNTLPQTPCTATVTGPGGLSQSLTVVYTNNTNVGTATASASYPGGPNHLPSSGSATFRILPREALVRYIGQLQWVTSGTSSTTAQVTLTASAQDPTGTGLVNATVDFIDAGTGKVLAAGVKVSTVGSTNTGTANTVVTLSAGRYGAESYLILVKMTGNYTNADQAMADKTATVVISRPAGNNESTGAGTIGFLPTSAGTLRSDNGSDVTFSVGMSYNKSLTNLQGKITVTIPRSDGVVYVKSNSTSSMSLGPSGSDPRKATIYTKASVYKVLSDGTVVTIDGNVTLRVDIADYTGGGPLNDEVGFSVLSSKNSQLFYSNNWVLDAAANAWKTVAQKIKTGRLAIN